MTDFHGRIREAIAGMSREEALRTVREVVDGFPSLHDVQQLRMRELVEEYPEIGDPAVARSLMEKVYEATADPRFRDDPRFWRIVFEAEMREPE